MSGRPRPRTSRSIAPAGISTSRTAALTASRCSRSIATECRPSSSTSPPRGHWPRIFLLLEDQRQMLVANERSGTIAILTLGKDGRLAPTGQTLRVPGAVFLAPTS
ncbi:beta-propeller fold lactonase family protein [Sphingomonas aerolata]|uniref:beta-propeller fold lactonase family protein n=1 Tax=Sphingomonas aerolata TaxID=185951 RepID=UPI003A5BD2DE